MRKHSSFRLRWSRYYQFILEGQIFYLKQKAFTNKHEGFYEWEIITEQTYKDAIKKGCKDNVIIVEEDILEVPTQVLTLMFNDSYDLSESDMRQAVYEAQEAIRYIRKHTKINYDTEYRVFKKVLQFHISMQREKEVIAI